ncbi:TetR family transcriptional regulator C-terminal domain-containing protein [Ampullimonas aquatilis]|uniref:TetR/AcrR family transcriptional regulator n=1 Tax=Ampullimonas aquatilis TaxID=1341549 RepID=UPI003C75BE8D
MSKDTRQVILQSATEIFLQKGYNGCGLNEILAAANVPKGSFYHYFESKEALAKAVLEDYANDTRTWFAEQHEQSRKGAALDVLWETLSAIRDQLVAKQFAGGCLLGTLAQELAGSNFDLVCYMKELFPRWEKQLGFFLESAVALGELPADTNVPELSAYLLDTWEGAVLRARLEKSPLPLDRFISYSKAMFARLKS